MRACLQRASSFRWQMRLRLHPACEGPACDGWSRALPQRCGDGCFEHCRPVLERLPRAWVPAPCDWRCCAFVRDAVLPLPLAGCGFRACFRWQYGRYVPSQHGTHGRLVRPCAFRHTGCASCDGRPGCGRYWRQAAACDGRPGCFRYSASAHGGCCASARNRMPRAALRVPAAYRAAPVRGGWCGFGKRHRCAFRLRAFFLRGRYCPSGCARAIHSGCGGSGPCAC